MATQCLKALRMRPQVKHHVIHGAPGTSHDLCLREWLCLIMHSAKRTLLRVSRNIALHDFRIQSVIIEFFLTPGAGKEASLV